MKKCMSDDPDYILDLTPQASSSAEGQPNPEASSTPGSDDSARPWVGVQFDCCGVYVRVYRNREATAYVGRCPRCLREARIRIGPSGSSHRLFRAT